ncbi:MAG TPA: transcription repressor NadR [Candidatus Fimicola cottocaccae]|uniref:transcription repressor NadR n=1 Tax=Tyzzerella sp. An114 TaxID=1965545 RepID=UPI001302E412|nr:transcription repressor NadR [Tyzzerella sp. An114]HIT73067.1 transcription repressor NadR [Candidatus Fimicola cottocaccae]
MNSDERRIEILKIINESGKPVTGKALAEKFGVTRQIIVKDIGIIKAAGNVILSTAKGYICENKKNEHPTREITVCHNSDDIENEMNIVVDMGGKILSTSVNHPVYGSVGEALNIKSRRDIKMFLNKTSETGCMPLLELTKGIHTHLISADDEETLDEICAELKNAGYLISTK